MTTKTALWFQEFRDRFLREGQSILEVGAGETSLAKHARGFNYFCADTQAIPGLNYVVSDSCEWDLKRQFDAVVCMDTLEHCSKPWVLMQSMIHHIQPHGYGFFVAPFSFFEHRFPKDYWRIAPDGMASLIDGQLRIIDCGIRHYGIRPDPCLLLHGKWVRPLATVCIARKSVYENNTQIHNVANNTSGYQTADSTPTH